MRVPGLQLSQIPLTRKVRADTDLRQFRLHDREHIEQAAVRWLHTVSREALAEVIRAGNPSEYALEIDGVTNAAGKVKRGAVFSAGTIEQAKRAVRAQFVTGNLAALCNSAKRRLQRVIAESFPDSKTKLLRRRWVWYVQPDALLLRNKKTPARYLGERVPEHIGIYDVLWLAPTFGGYKGAPGAYAWFANKLSMAAARSPWNDTQRRGRGLKDGKRTIYSGKRRVRRPRGFMAEASARIRGTRSQQQSGPISVQAMMVKETRSRSVLGMPVLRIAFRRSLVRPVSN